MLLACFSVFVLLLNLPKANMHSIAIHPPGGYIQPYPSPWFWTTPVPSATPKTTTSSYRKARLTLIKYHVVSRITARYSHVTITGVVKNGGWVAGKYPASIRLPKTAFISNFSIEVDDKVHVGEVKEKAKAKQIFQQASQMGQSAGLVSANTRTSQTFGITISVAAQSRVTFILEYQELLKRTLGVYKQEIFANHSQIIDNFKIEVQISETSEITKLSTQPEDSLIRRSRTQALITYPSDSTPWQNKWKSTSTNSFVITYDVKREKVGGELLIRNGYFVHFVAPESLPVIPKNVIFVIDQSGSMLGNKMQHTKEAFVAILDQLSPRDRFNIILFDHDVKIWKPGNLMKVNLKNIDEAKKHILSTFAGGPTNLYGAIIAGISLLENEASPEANTLNQASMLIVLTDGMPTSGIYTRESAILKHVTSRNNGRYSIFCLGFGADVNHNFLNKLANANRGVSRRIYDGSDAAMQLTGFYKEVASPILAHVIIKYSGLAVGNLTKTKFSNYFGGSEIVVSGLIPAGSKGLRASVLGKSRKGNVTLVTKSSILEDDFVGREFNLEKLWAYLSIQQLLQEKAIAPTDREKKEIDDEVLYMSLRHNFVTELTSMVAVHPKFKLPIYPVNAGGRPPNIQTRPSLSHFLQSNFHQPVGYIIAPPPVLIPQHIPPIAPPPVLRPPHFPSIVGPYPHYGLGAGPFYYTRSAAMTTTTTTTMPPSSSTTTMPPSPSTTTMPPSPSTTTMPPSPSTTTMPPSPSTTTMPPSPSTTTMPPSPSTTTMPPSTTTMQPSQSTTTTMPPSPSTTTTMPPSPSTTTTMPPSPSTTTIMPPSQSTTLPSQETTTTKPPLVYAKKTTIAVSTTFNITSPNYPGLYPTSATYTWNLHQEQTTADKKLIKVTFTEFDLEGPDGKQRCLYDKLKVEVKNPSASMKAEYCGFKSQPFAVIGVSVYLTFFSDEVISGRGFAATVRLVDK